MLSDNVKKALVLAASQPLPPAWRLRLRRPGLARLELEKATRTDLLIIGHPKSGNTWLRVLLSRLYQTRHNLPADLVVTSDELHRRNAAIPRISATNGWYSYEGVVGDALAVDAPPSPIRDKPIVFLPRHPLDIATSWYLQVTKRQSNAKFELINADLDRPIDRTRIDRWAFVRHSGFGLANIIAFLNTWQARVARLPHAITVPYEALRADPASQLARIGELMGDPFSADEIAEAVRFGSFDNLKSLESSGFFKQKGLRPGIRGDAESSKVRRARVGGYREDFTPEQVAELEALVAASLDPALGYAPRPASAGAEP
ncbi:MAG: sulfotransferase domain-containing protein [Geminicoccaceae bacterium]|jgi:hypothetical protein|nr:sulfotransferase domain-containing protein [Geminicoccaceae bacterium]MCB9966581.1 sulfotransferase domain-containing protein [Geminicoccaceae bacterium]HRY22795.1 sulfotransferase domain-containing protein [Geminicoccaceae bacterium]